MKFFISHFNASNLISTISLFCMRPTRSIKEIKLKRRRREEKLREFEAQQRERLIARLRHIIHREDQNLQDMVA